jgi:hypothetical protein
MCGLVLNPGVEVCPRCGFQVNNQPTPYQMGGQQPMQQQPMQQQPMPQQPMPQQTPMQQKMPMMMKNMLSDHMGNSSPFDIKLPSYPEFSSPLSIGCSFLRTNLSHLWGSEGAVHFGMCLQQLDQMEGEFEGIHYRQAYTILDNIKSEVNNYDELKAKLDRAVEWRSKFNNLGGWFGLKPEVVQPKFLFIKSHFVGMNKEKASMAMSDFNNNMNNCVKALDKIASKETITFGGLPGTYNNYRNDILEFKDRFMNKVSELNNLFGAALNMEIDNPEIGKKYEMMSSYHDPHEFEE